MWTVDYGLEWERDAKSWRMTGNERQRSLLSLSLSLSLSTVLRHVCTNDGSFQYFDFFVGWLSRRKLEKGLWKFESISDILVCAFLEDVYPKRKGFCLLKLPKSMEYQQPRPWATNKLRKKGTVPKIFFYIFLMFGFMFKLLLRRTCIKFVHSYLVTMFL